MDEKSKTIRDNRLTEKALNEASKLQELFPELVWLKVLDSIGSDLKTLGSLSLSSVYLRNLLKERLYEDLAGRALTVVVAKGFVARIQDREDTDGNSSEEPAPKRFKSAAEIEEKAAKTSRLALLQLRKVSKAYRLAVDEYVESQQSKLAKFSSDEHFSLPINHELVLVDNRSVYTFANRAQITSFLTIFHDGYVQGLGNPVIGRHLVIHDNVWSDDRDLYLGLLYEFLKVLGSEILYITFRERHYHVEEKYEVLKKILDLLPNLKALNVGWNNGDTNRSNKWLVEHLSRKNVYGFANLKHLDTLQIFNAPLLIFKDLLTANAQVSHLEVSFNYNTKKFNFNTIFKGLENLKSVEWTAEGNVRVEKIANPICGGQKLERFGFIVLGNHPQATKSTSLLPPLEWTLFQSTISKVCQELVGVPFKMLTIGLPEIPNHFLRSVNKMFYREPMFASLRLPCAQIIRIYMRPYYNLDFLLNSNYDLKHLEVAIANANDLNHPCYIEAAKIQTIEWLGFEDRMNQSNIWKLFPNLIKVAIIRNTSNSKVVSWYFRP